MCRRHGISGATFYKWKAKYGGLDVSDAKRLKSLEDESASCRRHAFSGKLKKLLAEAMLDVVSETRLRHDAIRKDVNSREW